MHHQTGVLFPLLSHPTVLREFVARDQGYGNGWCYFKTLWYQDLITNLQMSFVSQIFRVNLLSAIVDLII